MIIEESFRINAPQSRVVAFFLDIDQLSRCIPGVEGVTEVAPDKYEGLMAVSVGPVRAAFNGTVALNRAEVPERFKATGRGKDRATGSSAVIEFSADLEGFEDYTQVDITADVSIRGRLGRFGTGVIQATATELVREFVNCADATLGEPQGTITAHQASSQDAGRLVMRGIVAYLRSLLRRLWRAISGQEGKSAEKENAGT